MRCSTLLLPVFLATLAQGQDTTRDIESGRRAVLEQMAARDFVGALKRIKILSTSFTHEASFMVMEGECHYSLEQWERSVSAFARALSVDRSLVTRIPHHPLALMKLARIDDASKIYGAMAESAPSDAMRAQGEFGLGLVEIHKGNTGAAVKHMKTAHKLDPDSRKINVRLGILLRGQGRFDAAITHFKEALSGYGLHQAAVHNLALAYFGKGDRVQADQWRKRHMEVQQAHREIGVIRAKLRGAPGNPALLRRLGDIHHTHDCHQASLAPYSAVLRAIPGDLDTRLRLATSLARTGRNQEARQHIDVILKLQPRHPGALDLMGRLGNRDG